MKNSKTVNNNFPTEEMHFTQIPAPYSELLPELRLNRTSVGGKIILTKGVVCPLTSFQKFICITINNTNNLSFLIFLILLHFCLQHIMQHHLLRSHCHNQQMFFFPFISMFPLRI